MEDQQSKSSNIERVEKVLQDPEVQAKAREVAAEVEAGIKSGKFDWFKLVGLIAILAMVALGSGYTGSVLTKDGQELSKKEISPSAKTDSVDKPKEDSKPSPKEDSKTAPVEPKKEVVVKPPYLKFVKKDLTAIAGQPVWLELDTNCASIEWVPPDGEVSFRAMTKDNVAYFSAKNVGTYKVWVLAVKDNVILKDTAIIKIDDR